MDQYPDWSPDGTQIVFSHRFQGILSLWKMNANGSNQQQIAGDGNDHPAWSPDGTQIVFQAFPTDSWDILIMNPDGSGQTPVVASEADEQFAEWQPVH